MKVINFGIIGCGDVTEKKSGPAFQKIEGSNLLTVMRRDKEKLMDYAKRHNVPKYSTDYLDLLKDKEIDAVYIATPPNMHHFYTLEAAKYGKAVYVEKPMALTTAECEEMIHVCRDKNVPLFVAYYRRGQEKFKKVKELIDTKEIGEIRSFNYLFTSKTPTIDPKRSWVLNSDIAGGGMLYDVGSHMVDMITYLFGDVKMASGISANQSKNFGVNDVTTGIIQFKNDIQGSIQLSFNANESRDEFIIIGSEGTLKLSIMSNENLTVIKDDKTYEISFAPMEHVQLPYIKKVVNTLLGKDNYDTSGTYGLRTQEILEAFNNSTSVKYDK
jgi:1,5-anhydro-D-fructose reductase (1,5-anhydro-D-mannitol-forming)